MTAEETKRKKDKEKMEKFIVKKKKIPSSLFKMK